MVVETTEVRATGTCHARGGGSGRPEAEVTGTLQTQAWRRASGRLGAVGVQV